MGHPLLAGASPGYIAPLAAHRGQGDTHDRGNHRTGIDTASFIAARTKEIKAAVGEGTAINALSGGVDSSTVTMLGHRALGGRLRSVFIDNGLMRAGEPERVVSLFRALGVTVEIVDAQKEFFAALHGVSDPEEKREAITQTF